MIENGHYSAATQGAFELFDLGNLVLEPGETLRRARLAYRTLGTLNADKSNAILVTTWFSGTAKVMEDVYVGPDHALDPGKYFIIIADQLGDGVSTSPQNNPAPQTMGKFPKLSIGDDVAAQHKLVTEHFGIDRLALVVGGSMGGQQVYEWAVEHSDMVERAAPIAATAQISLHQQVFVQALEEAIMSDPAWNGGWYASGLDVRNGMDRMARIVATLGWSRAFYQEERWRSVLGMSSLDDFINGVMKAYFEPMDPNVLLCEMHKWRRADVGRHAGGDLAAALGRITAKTCIMPIDHDLFFPPDECELDRAMIPGATLAVIGSKEGHMGLNGFEPGYMAQVDATLADLLTD
ncbi:alpha/beta fold hydrolase [Sagittula stellata]|uniref:Homoserine O-acetyltransferase n=1 Tax=Sagittula stellata (strain ATCC 700073 / DSM 11524 / E-37) TaxID=388399 RepID=A3K4I0_SAGS3|nr:alpha/beta fold hydrolase [Sagittula stellata]EBA07879.1 homoserine O-acetyltransferase [Sagittula stellata E-37]